MNYRFLFFVVTSFFRKLVSFLINLLWFALCFGLCFAFEDLFLYIFNSSKMSFFPPKRGFILKTATKSTLSKKIQKENGLITILWL